MAITIPNSVCNQEKLKLIEIALEALDSSATDHAATDHTVLSESSIAQSATDGAAPVLTLTQADVDEDYISIVGTSDASADRALVDAADFTTPGAIVGWLKILVTDLAESGDITDGDYYIPFYAVPEA